MSTKTESKSKSTESAPAGEGLVSSVLFSEVDRRPRKDWWAPGDYFGRCVICGQQFIGDKRAGHCAPCAYGDDERFHRFGRQVWRMITDLGGDFCGEEISEEILPMAVSAGLCKRVVFDPELHGDMEAEPGDEVWWWGDWDKENKGIHTKKSVE